MTPREWFTTAADGYLTVVSGASADVLDAPGLGEWDVRSLLGHSARAFQTIETYLAAEPEAISLRGPSEYFIATRAGLADPVAVTERGRAAGIALGDDPITAIGEIADRVLALVNAEPDDAVATTPVGAITLLDYLPTRAFELTVHGLDLAAATRQSTPKELAISAVDAAQLAIPLSGPTRAAEILFALTGRGQLAEGFSVL
ncbi:maleylpyruvate isomerase N-terminal domain-containing protein [Cumulibacter soli]|uniref:maleylpyruvate isomerase N-terminal domain-containing protein n=1 Tax=Cumulibacter soli TaxID=2546344 RepID=UPI001068923C|nr:maleylpyruvate isomerase N-terminal domain-containing protein [Cumulibacter soli]